MRRSTSAVAVSLLGALLTGCSSIPPGGDPAAEPSLRALKTRGAPTLGRVAVAPVTTLSLAPDEATKGWKVGESEAISAERLRSAVISAFSGVGGFERVRASGPDPLAEAWTERDDLVATVAIDGVRTRYEGRNGWWIPNIANWLFWIVPAWFVATEDYTLSLDASVVLRSAESGATVARATIPVAVTGSFDEFDRGWQFFGFVYSTLDGPGWRGIAGRLWPAAERELAAGLARGVDEALRKAAASGALESARRKTLVLAIGVGRAADPAVLPPLPFAAEDARTVADAFLAAGSPREHVLLLTDTAASASAVTAALAEHLGRAREGDTVVLHFAGYGTRAPDGQAALLLEDGVAGTPLRLADLAATLGALQGRKLLVVDASFGGTGSRAAPPFGDGGERSSSAPDDLAPLEAAQGLSTILAGGPGEPALAPPHLGRGLLTHHLIEGLRGSADEDRDGRLTFEELHGYVRGRVIAEAALAGGEQTPRIAGRHRGFALELSASRGAGREGR